MLHSPFLTLLFSFTLLLLPLVTLATPAVFTSSNPVPIYRNTTNFQISKVLKLAINFDETGPSGYLALEDPISTVANGFCKFPKVDEGAKSFGLPLGVYQPCSPATYQYAIVSETSLRKFSLRMEHTIERDGNVWEKYATTHLEVPGDEPDYTILATEYAFESLAPPGWNGDPVSQ